MRLICSADWYECEVKDKIKMTAINILCIDFAESELIITIQ